MFGLFKKKARAAPPFRKELASPEPTGFTAQEIATFNGSYLLVRAAVYELGGELPSRWNESFSAFEERAPNLTFAQAWMIRAFYNGLQASLSVSADRESKIADRIGRTYLNAYPAAVDSLIGRACLATQEAFVAYLNRLDDDEG
ncbi:hypothetical protein [Phenylobacterium sp.]|uniref:hypothetical protein n=1 Tax=Phenylobacterium sp. TaxID=1871053 RepID=UPI0035B0B0B1